MVARPGPRVRLWAVQTRRDKPAPYYVRWVVGHTTLSRSFTHKAEADDLHARLRIAATDGLRFDSLTGFPVAWARNEWTVASWCSHWLRRRWNDLAPKTRAGLVEAISVGVPLFVLPAKAGAAPVGLPAYIRDVMCAPQPNGERDAISERYLARFSLPLDMVTATTGADAWAELGKGRAPATAKRLRKDFRSILTAAVRENLMDANPMPVPQSKTTKQRTSSKVGLSQLPSPIEVRSILAAIPSHQPSSHTIELLIRSVYLAGWRPGEALGLDVSDLSLPAGGWGEANINTSRSNATSRWLDDATERTGPPKARAPGDSRTVPLCPELVEDLRQHLGGRTSGLVFLSRTGEPLSPSNVNRAWQRAKQTVLVQGHPHLDNHVCRVHDLRHLHATLSIRAGVGLPEISRRLGHSVETLVTVYADLLPDDTQRANGLLEAVL